MNIDTSAVIWVVIDNFNMMAKEMERQWAKQDKYIKEQGDDVVWRARKRLSP